uniref:Uncharacterized protein n=1 Tax=Megaselia scalaris TaxID=36166 RepID=T1GQD2_MEGSC
MNNYCATAPHSGFLSEHSAAEIDIIITRKGNFGVVFRNFEHMIVLNCQTGFTFTSKDGNVNYGFRSFFDMKPLIYDCQL